MNDGEVLRRLNAQTFEVEERRPADGWKSLLEEVLAEEFVLRRSRPELPNETKQQMIDRIASDQYEVVPQEILPESQRIWSSDDVGVVGRERAPGPTSQRCCSGREATDPAGHPIRDRGDMNDPPDSAWLDPLVKSSGLGLVNGINKPTEIPTLPAGKFPADTAWTDRYKPSGKPAEYRLFDQVWLSPALAPAWQSAWIGRRKNLTGDGTDHDPRGLSSPSRVR